MPSFWTFRIMYVVGRAFENCKQKTISTGSKVNYNDYAVGIYIRVFLFLLSKYSSHNMYKCCARTNRSDAELFGIQRETRPRSLYRGFTDSSKSTWNVIFGTDTFFVL